MLKKTIIKKKEYITILLISLKERIFHKNKIKLKEKIGILKNKNKFLNIGIKILFKKSFNASAIGWKIPQTLTLTGPLRNWTNPKIFRSIKVTKATIKRQGIVIIKYEAKKVYIT